MAGKPVGLSIQDLRYFHEAEQDQERLAFGSALNNGLVFCVEDGKPIDPRNFTRRWERLLKEAGLPHVRFHDARHTFVTMLLEAGEDSRMVQEPMGHSEISITLHIYSHVSTASNERLSIG